MICLLFLPRVDQFYYEDIRQMLASKAKDKIKTKNRSFNQQKILASAFNPIPFDVNLVSNPYLKGQEKYQYLIQKMKDYNDCVTREEVMDSYETMVYGQLSSLLANLVSLLTRDLQIDRLNQVHTWFSKEEKLLMQRVNQGNIRYKVTKDYLKDMASQETSPQFMKSQDYAKIQLRSLLPSEAIKHKNLPYIKNWRTTHKQLQGPEIRLQEYTRKNLNFSHLYSSEKQQNKAPKIVYPKIPKLKYAKQYDVEEGVQDQANKYENSPPTNLENPQVQGQAQLREGEKPVEAIQNKVEQPPGQDLGLGEEPQDQPEEQEQNQQGDKLAPRLKSYIYEPKSQTKQQALGHKRMNDRYLKIQNDFVRKQNEDSQFVEMMHSWAARKAQLDKQVIKRIENMGINYNKYKQSYQDPQKEESFSIQDAKKYGLSKTFDIRNKKIDLDLSSGLELPSIRNKSDIYEKSIKKDKLKNLKKRFSKMLDIKDYQDRDVAQSMCQVEEKRKGFSQILRKHSKSKERLKQLDQVVTLKQKLARQKISIDITALSMSLCAPEDQQNLPQGAFPMKNLLSNPFWVEPAKKKKKK